MAYCREEMETTCVYDYLNNDWIVYSNVQKHITKLLKIAGEPIWSEIEENRLVSGKWKLGHSQVGFRKIIESKPHDSQQNSSENEN